MLGATDLLLIINISSKEVITNSCTLYANSDWIWVNPAISYCEQKQ